MFCSKRSLEAVTRIFMTLVIVGVASRAAPQKYPLQATRFAMPACEAEIWSPSRGGGRLN